MSNGAMEQCSNGACLFEAGGKHEGTFLDHESRGSIEAAELNL